MKKVFQDLILDPLKYSGTLMASPFPDPLSSPCMEMKTSSLGVLVVFLNGCFSYVCVCMFEFLCTYVYLFLHTCIYEFIFV